MMYRLIMKYGNSNVRSEVFGTIGEAIGYAQHNGYRKRTKRTLERIKTDCYYPNYEIVEVRTMTKDNNGNIILK